MLNDEIKLLLQTNKGKWDNKIAFSPKEVAEMLGIPQSTVTQHCREGFLTVFKIGRHYRITRISLYRYIEAMTDAVRVV